MMLPPSPCRSRATLVVSVTIAALTLGTAACGSDAETSIGSHGGSSASGGAGGLAGSGGSAGQGAQAGGSAQGGSSGGGGLGGTSASSRIVVDPEDPAWLAYEAGGSYFLCSPGDPEGFLYRGSRNSDGTRSGDQADLIAKLAPTGANGIYLMAVRSHGGDGANDENPFVDANPALGLDDELLTQWESWFSAMDEAGITIYFIFYDDSARIWDTGDAVGSDEQAMVQGLVDRFEHHERLVWVVAEEYAERFSAARVSAIAAAIRSADDLEHVVAVHQNHGLTFAFASDAAIDQFAIQYNVDTTAEIHTGVVSAFQSAAGAFNLNLAEVANHGTGTSARLKSWAAAMGGAYVMVLGADIASTPIADLEDCGRLRRFFESTDLSAMAPHDELAHAGSQYVLAASDARHVLYASTATATLGVRALPTGSYTLHWLDPATGATVDETADVAGGDTSFPKPSAIGAEVALYLRSAR